MTRETRQQRRIDRSQPTTTRSERKQQQQVRVERKRTTQQPVVQTRQQQKRVERAAPRQRVERKQRQQPRDNAFNRVDQGIKERRSSERGRSSWTGRPGNTRSSRGESRSYRDRSGR